MLSAVCAVLTLLAPAGPLAGQAPCASYLYQPAYCLDDVRRGPAVPYDPQPGDIFLSTDQEWWARAGHWLAGAKGLHHSGIMFRRSDGRTVAATAEERRHSTPELLAVERRLIDRSLARRNERVSWPLLRRSKPGIASQFADIGGFIGLSSPKRIEISPYALTRNQSALRSNGYTRTAQATRKYS